MRRTRLNPARIISALLLTAGGAGSALAGPDVIVGDLYQISNLGGSAGKHAYAVGTISCNLGDAPLTWVDCTSGPNCNVHPVISQNLYRLQNGRFEQIGQAWLKHGFCALQGTVCSACTPGGTCDALFPGCSDPYSSSLNGTQSGLGPKSEVNAATGAFPYPWINQGVNTDATLFKRLQANDADLALPGAVYFVTSSYVQPEDAAAGNDDNNQSYRRVTIGAAPGYTMALADTTQRTKPGLQAWKDNDATVTISNVDVPGDGRFIIASKATDLGGGVWHYEYAVQNLNSDRSGGAFTVPLPAGAVVTNVGFHDVDYHSGEPYALTDWAATVSSTDITWACQTEAQNANANALRFDTVYNFRFDCDVTPGSGSATIGMFKAGSPASASGAATIPAGGPPPPPTPPANDNCASAIVVTAGSTAFTTVNATTDGPDEPAACTFGSSTTVAMDVWYRYTAPCAGSATVSLCGSGFDTKLAIYSGSACPTGGAAIACNDDAGGACGVQSQVTFTVAASTDYLIRIGSAAGATGTGTMTITGPTCAPTGPANNACANAITVSDGVPVSGTTVGATNDASATCGSSTTSPDVWYAYTPAISATVTASTCNNASFDTVLAIYSACGGSQVACLDDTTGCSGYTTTLSASLTGGVRYLIRVAGYNGATGTFTLTVSGGSAPTPPFNDNCQNRAGIGTGAISFDTRGATTDGPNHPSCLSGGSDLVTNDVWFNFPAQSTGTATFSTCGATFDTRLAIYDDSGGGGCLSLDTRLIGCSDNFPCGTGNGLQSQVTVSVTAGRNYTVRLGGTGGATGTGTLNVTLTTGAAEVILMSFTGTTTVPGVGTVENEDIVSYTPSTGQWALVFDGSDVGLSALAFDGMARMPSGDFLLSFTAAATIPGMTGGPSGSTTLDDSDIVRFIPTSLGATTAGSLVFYFDGSDVGLTTDNEDVDGIALTSDGKLVLSTLGTFSVTGLTGEDEDLIVFTATSLGATTAGTFAMYFDGSDVGLADSSSEDVDGVAIRADGSLLLSTVGAFSVTGASGTGADVLRFTPTTLGPTTSGAYALHLALSAIGIDPAANIGSLDVSTSGTAVLALPGIRPSTTRVAVRNAPATLVCPADFDEDDAVTVADVASFVNAWITSVQAGGLAGDFDGNGIVEPADVGAFVNTWLTGLAAGC